jgi:hypothetical protein
VLSALLAPPVTVPPPRYTGSFYALEAAGGLGRSDARNGLSVDLGVRASSVLQMADIAARYELLRVDDASLHAGVVSAQFHPFFMFMLGADRLWTTLASVYLRLGLGGGHATHAGFTGLWDWGAGLDTPITEPDAGSSLWLGFEYRRTSFLDTSGDPLQSFLLRAGWRFNAL